MKYIINISLICLLIISGCKKDKDDRIITIYGTNRGDIRFITYTKNHPSEGEGGGTELVYPGKVCTHTLEYGRGLKLDIKSDSANFSCKVTVNGKNIYDHIGKEHHLEF